MHPHRALWPARTSGRRSFPGDTGPIVPLEQVSAGSQADIGPRRSPDWSVFDPEGRYLGVVRMPDRFKPMVSRSDNIYGVWRDDLDVQYVLRLRILGMPERQGSVGSRSRSLMGPGP